jgi:hypothetical protein
MELREWIAVLRGEKWTPETGIQDEPGLVGAATRGPGGARLGC